MENGNDEKMEIDSFAGKFYVNSVYRASLLISCPGLMVILEGWVTLMIFHFLKIYSTKKIKRYKRRQRDQNNETQN